MIRRPPRSTLDRSSAASDVYKRQAVNMLEDQAWLGGSVSYAETAVDKARFNFQSAIKVLYQPEDNIEVKPILEHKEYDVGEIPDASDQLKK